MKAPGICGAPEAYDGGVTSGGPIEPGVPSRRRMLVHRAKVRVHQVRRGILEAIDPVRPRPGARTQRLVEAPLLAEVRSPLWRQEDPREWILQAGKVENLRVARAAFDGVELSAAQVFSFWAHLGRPSRRRGFVAGRELREGCVVPSIAGGICQLSNALYAAARDAGLQIVERHAHTRVLPGSEAARDRDATVLWNYVDLRFVAGFPLRIEVELTPAELVVRLRGESPALARQTHPRILQVESSRSDAASCLSCDQAECARSVSAPRQGGERAFLVDGVWPEHDAWVRAEARAADRLLMPIDGRRWGRVRYAWCADAFARDRVHTFVHEVIWRAYVSRRLAQQGAQRQRALLDLDARLAKAMAAKLGPEVTHLVVAQSLLPHLWAGGHLGGRRFDVLATRMPLASLHAALDAAARRHPCSPTAADFRADAWLLQAEADALAAADRVITPHSAVADAIGARAVMVPWHLPAAIRIEAARDETGGGRRVLFAGSTVARKGCYELREALRDLDVQLQLGGSQLEGDGFWGAGVGPAGGPVDLVVLPAWVEHAPRVVLREVAAGVPAIVSTACGLRGLDGVTEVAPGDTAGLRRAIVAALGDRAAARHPRWHHP